MIRIQISEDALQDLNDGFMFYEAQEVGLGGYFAACLRADIEGLRVSAGAHRMVWRLPRQQAGQIAAPVRSPEWTARR